MIFDNMEFHNVAELIPMDGGYAMPRVPHTVALDAYDGLHPRFHSSGVELRFRILSGEVELYLHKLKGAGGTPLQIMFGSFQGGWDLSTKQIGEVSTCIHIRPTPKLCQLQKTTAEHHLPYAPELIRLLLPAGTCIYEKVDGHIEPPRKEDAPAKTCLVYGSSITHGSLALGSRQTYAARLTQKLGMDMLNLGFAGFCHMEEAMAQYMIERKDWDIAVLEIGVNMCGFEKAAFTRRVSRFAEILRTEQRPIFATSIFGQNGETDPEVLTQYRAILREHFAGFTHFVDGTELLDDPSLISEDLIHPSFEGHEQIADRWYSIIQERLSKKTS